MKLPPGYFVKEETERIGDEMINVKRLYYHSERGDIKLKLRDTNEILECIETVQEIVIYNSDGTTTIKKKKNYEYIFRVCYYVFDGRLKRIYPEKL
jgi:hypothetical protein